ncbi:hypothetical protein PENSPDRAFT_130427 [Peniophora sp. CONT]|nr:hypothetical protein PENSPDRAFT_130427 [Peniophora sp. CONT]
MVANAHKRRHALNLNHHHHHHQQQDVSKLQYKPLLTIHPACPCALMLIQSPRLSSVHLRPPALILQDGSRAHPQLLFHACVKLRRRTSKAISDTYRLSVSPRILPDSILDCEETRTVVHRRLCTDH